MICLRCLSLLVCLLPLYACSMAPKYVQPASPVSEQWPDAYLPGEKLAEADERRAADMHWRECFLDGDMQRLIALALLHNRDLRVSALNIEKARAMYQIQRAEQLPSIGASGSLTESDVPGDVSMTGKRTFSREYSLGVGISAFELDFFGRIQSLKDAALEEYLGTEEAWRSARLSLIAQVASSVISLVADRERHDLAKDTLVSQQASYDMIRRRHEEGVSSELDLRQAQISVDTARVDLARYAGQEGIDLAALSLLTGVQVTPDMIKARRLSEIRLCRDIPVGLTTDVLLRRPDILQAEHLLKSANANIGAARANFFPRISLTLFTGSVTDTLERVLNSHAGMWSTMPEIFLPIFEGGRNIANLKASETQKKIAIAQYEQAIQAAFRETSEALILRVSLANRLAAQQSLAEAASSAYRLSTLRYEQGVDSYLNVLDSQRSTYSAQMAVVTARAEQEQNLVMLFKALGGGTATEDANPERALDSVPETDPRQTEQQQQQAAQQQ